MNTLTTPARILMPKVKALTSPRLCTNFPADRIPWETSADIARNTQRRMPQPRALQALELALNIHVGGYNIFLSGSSNLGRTYMLREFLAPKVKKCPTPPDLLYVNNFEDQDRPHLIAVPAGQGKKLRTALASALVNIRKELPSRLERETYIKKRGAIQDKFQSVRSRLIKDMDDIAGEEGFNLDMDDNGSLTLYPLVEGKRLSEDDFDRLDATLRQSFKQKGDALLRTMSGLVHKLTKAEKEFRADEKGLDQEIVASVLDTVLAPVLEKTLRACPNNAPLEGFFTALRADMLDNPEAFLPRDTTNAPSLGLPESLPQPEFDPYRYAVNLFVDNAQLKGAPIMIEDHPTHANLLGCIEREAEMGALVTDFTLIKAGSLHKANGGFLVLHLEDILQYPHAFEGLMRALHSNTARFEEGGDMPDGVTRTKGIEPEPLPLQVKVVLVGNEELHDALLAHDDRFPKLFKIKAHMNDVTERTADGIRAWIMRLARIIDEAGLLPFSRAALAGLVDFSSRTAEDQRKLSLKYPLVRDVMIEASAMTSMANKTLVEREHLDAALAARMYRVNPVEELYLEEYDRELIKVHTTGEAVGRVNGLSVSWYGDFEFGLPHQITCTVGVGHGGIIDLEREAELGGPIHTKAMLILKSYLVDQFAKTKPLVLTGSLCFEQNYAGVEGDSASGAELAALLSAISEVPLSSSFAFTGAVSQLGQIMAVGGVSRKIEGFFDVCARRGLTGHQGVILPYDNIDHLMLAPKICKAVDDGLFAIYPVRHMTEAMELLTGLPAGRPLRNGGFTKGSLYDLVDKRLEALGHMAEHAFSKRLKKKSSSKTRSHKQD